MRAAEPEDVYGLSPLQQGILFHAAHSPESDLYFNQVVFGLSDIDPRLLQQAWNAVIDVTPALRTSFHWEGLEKPVQVVHRAGDVLLALHDWSELSEGEQEIRLEQFLDADRRRPFDLTRAPLMRLSLVATRPEKSLLVWSYPHILFDGWSRPLIESLVFRAYGELSQGGKAQLAESRPFKSYLAWLRRQDTGAAERFWRRNLAGFDRSTSLPAGRVAASSSGSLDRVEDVSLELSEERTQEVMEASRAQQVTVNTVVQGAWALLLGRYSGAREVVFGATVSGRPAELEGVEQMVGLFINTLPVRVRVEEQQETGQWLRELQRQQAELRQYEYSPLAEVQRWSELAPGTPLFDSILVFENYPTVPDDAAAALADAPSATLEKLASREKAHYPLVAIFAAGSRLTLKILYDADRYTRAAAERLARQTLDLVEELAQATARGALLSGVAASSTEERERVISTWNATATCSSRPTTIPDLFLEQVSRSPLANAVVFEDQVLTYGELRDRAESLAAHLRRLGVGRESLVPIAVERSVDMVVGVLGTLLAGAAYVPLELHAGHERSATVLRELAARVVLTQERICRDLPSGDASVILLDSWSREWQRIDTPVPRHGVSPHALAYVSYTSGSTGRPKGVCVTHANVCRLTLGTACADVSSDDVFFQYAPLAFDASTLEIWGALLNGACVAVAPPRLLSVDELGHELRRHAVTVLWLTSGLFHEVADQNPAALRGVRKLFTGGDIVSPAHVARVLEEGVVATLVSAYGPTENTTFTTCHRIDRPLAPGASVPIGRPISDTAVYILDPRLRPVGVGVPGELYAAGAGVARGYLGDPRLTAEKFLPDPFSAAPGARMYRTGDFARWNDEGTVEFLGRNDGQLKMRGFRVELGEIETALTRLPAIRQAAVVARRGSSGSAALAAYVTASSGASVIAEEIKRDLRTLLPEYMVPTEIYTLDVLPLTKNGKVDRARLSSMTGDSPDRPAATLGPRDTIELQLVELWRELFGREAIGVQEGFFELGGHSLLALRAIAQIKKRLGQTIALADLLEADTIERTAVLLRKGRTGARRSPLVAVNARGRRAPFFCPHPFGGGVICYVPLAEALGPDQPFYAFEQPGLYGECEPFATIPDLACLYVDEVQRIQPAGPYRLGGWSFGGVIAFEMASQLRRSGDEVELLALFDSKLADAPGQSRKADAEVNYVELVRSALGTGLEVDEETFARLDFEGKLLHLLERMREQELITPDVGRAEVEPWLSVLAANQRAYSNYVPEPYTAALTLFCAGDGPSATSAADLGWERVASHIDVHVVTGSHESMLQAAENARIVADVLAERLR